MSRFKRNRKRKYVSIILSLSVLILTWTAWKLFTSYQARSAERVQPAAEVSKPVDTTERQTGHTPEQFGADGFDHKPDTEALQEAINSSSSLTLKSGATYIIDKPLVSKRPITIQSDDTTGTNPVILQTAKQSAFIFENKPIASTYVIQPIAYSQPYVVVADARRMRAGQLLQLRSTKLWYWDNRGYLTKGELHRITKVDGNKVYLDRPAQERYKVGKEEAVTATVFANASLKLRHISFQHPKPYNTIMLRISYTTNAVMEHVSVTNSKRIGVFLNSTFRTKVSHARISLGTTKDIPSGYGIQDYGGSDTFITHSVFTKVRRGVDFSGDVPSRYGTVANCRAYGPAHGVLASGNSGFGTHSTAEHITFENNYVENFSYGFLARGVRITVKQNTLKGASRSFIAVSYGNHVNVSNNTYESINNSSLESFVMLLNTYRGTLSLTGNTIVNSKGPLIQGDTSRLSSLIIEGNITKFK